MKQVIKELLAKDNKRLIRKRKIAKPKIKVGAGNNYFNSKTFNFFKSGRLPLRLLFQSQ